MISYARISTDDQNLDLQRDALERAGCEKIYYETQHQGQLLKNIRGALLEGRLVVCTA